MPIFVPFSPTTSPWIALVLAARRRQEECSQRILTTVAVLAALLARPSTPFCNIYLRGARLTVTHMLLIYYGAEGPPPHICTPLCLEGAEGSPQHACMNYMHTGRKRHGHAHVVEILRGGRLTVTRTYLINHCEAEGSPLHTCTCYVYTGRRAHRRTHV